MTSLALFDCSDPFCVELTTLAILGTLGRCKHDLGVQIYFKIPIPLLAVHIKLGKSFNLSEPSFLNISKVNYTEHTDNLIHYLTQSRNIINTTFQSHTFP